eukprot:1638798-Pleurochrysis_carterae.AAC.2
MEARAYRAALGEEDQQILRGCGDVAEQMVPQVLVGVPPARRSSRWTTWLTTVFLRDGRAGRDVPAVPGTGHRHGLGRWLRGASQGEVHRERDDEEHRVAAESQHRHVLHAGQGRRGRVPQVRESPGCLKACCLWLHQGSSSERDGDQSSLLRNPAIDRRVVSSHARALGAGRDLQPADVERSRRAGPTALVRLRRGRACQLPSHGARAPAGHREQQPPALAPNAQTAAACISRGRVGRGGGGGERGGERGERGERRGRRGSGRSHGAGSELELSGQVPPTILPVRMYQHSMPLDYVISLASRTRDHACAHA